MVAWRFDTKRYIRRQGHSVGGGIDRKVIEIPRELEKELEKERRREKWCPQCRQYLELGMFYENRTRSDGLCGVCKECDNRNRMARGYYR